MPLALSGFQRCRRRVLPCLAALGVCQLGACGGDGFPERQVGDDTCGAGPYFTVLPVSPVDIDMIAVIGGLGAPGHTLPTAHSGFLLAREGVPVLSPGLMGITAVRRVTYLSSPVREGETDFALHFRVCRDVEGWFGHLTSLGTAIPQPDAGDCQTYSTADETVETCTTTVANVTVTAGQPLGTGGLSADRGLLGLDFGLTDARVSNFYVTPSRHPDVTLHAVCPYEYFDAANQATLLAKIRDPARPTESPSGEPRCGTMEVDVAGTAKGVWAENGVFGPVSGDETRYITLADYPYRPQERLALSLGPSLLGAKVAVTGRATSGRVNRAFEDVSGDGLIYCYAGDTGLESWLLSLDADGFLTIERIAHATGAGPCAEDPSSWGFGGGALTLVR